jgi:hypothetical protein
MLPIVVVVTGNVVVVVEVVDVVDVVVVDVVVVDVVVVESLERCIERGTDA